MKHFAADDQGYSAEDLEKALDRVAAEIAARGAAGKKLLPIFARLEGELESLRRVDDLMAKAMARLK